MSDNKERDAHLPIRSVVPDGMTESQEQGLADGPLGEAQAMMIAALKILDGLNEHHAAAHLAQAITVTGASAPFPSDH